MNNNNKSTTSLFAKLEIISNAVTSNFTFSNMEDVPEFFELTQLFKLSVLELSLLSIIATRSPKLKEINEYNLISCFSKGNISRSEVILSLKKLSRKNIIVKGHSRREDTYELENSYSHLLENDDYEGLRSLNETGVVPFLKLISKAINYDEHSMQPYFTHWEERENTDSLFHSALEENKNLHCVQEASRNMNVEENNSASQLFFLVLARRILMDATTSPLAFFASKKISVWSRKSFMNQFIFNGAWWPIQKGYIEIMGHDFMSNEIELEVTDKGVQELFPELSAEIVESLLDSNTITVPHKKPESILKQSLIFDAETNRLLRPISKSMNPSIRQKISEKFGHRKLGFTSLFYGYPGTGKTEYCLQLAKEFEMPIYEVNVAQIQDKWVGESEKNARKIFREYAKLRKQSKKECILLFNEADALFSKRLDVNSSVDTMNNALKNIFLEEMERFEGILLATTNLTGNLDPAFERRFLFKVFFNKPELSTKIKIWKLYFKGLSDDFAQQLSQQFEFSPGEIVNVHIRYEIEKILGNKKNRNELIKELCLDEKIKSPSSQNSKKVGFN